MNRQQRRRGSQAKRSAAAGLLLVGVLTGFGVTAAGALDLGGQTVPVEDALEPIDEAVTQLPVPLPAPSQIIEDTTEPVTGVVGGLPTTTLPDPDDLLTDPSLPDPRDLLGGGGTTPTVPDIRDVLGGGTPPTLPGLGGDPPLTVPPSGGSDDEADPAAPDPSAEVEAALLELLQTIKDLETEICASPLGELLQQIGEGTAPVTAPVKQEVLAGLTDVLTEVGAQLDQDQLGLLPTAVDIFVLQGLLCPASDDGGPGPDPTPDPDPDPTPDPDPGPYGPCPYGGGAYGYGGGDCPGPDIDPVDEPPAGEPVGPTSSGGTLPFTGAGALALAGLGAGLIGGGHLLRRSGSRTSV